MCKARELGLDVVYVQHPGRYDQGHWPYVDHALLLDYADSDELLPLVRTLHEMSPFQAVLTLSDFGLLPAAQLSETFGIGGESVTTVELLLDKSRMRERLAERGIGPVASGVGRTNQDVKEFVQVTGLPIIVKPTRESGSLAIFHVRHQEDADTVADRYLSLADKEWKPGDLGFADSFDDFLMEEFLDGPEVSVETLSFDGQHVVVAVTDKELGGTGFAEVGLSTPSRQPGETLREATRLVADLLDAVGLRNGPAHTEVKLTSRGPRIVESHNRIGGGGINDMTETVYGIDMERYALAAGLGVLEPLTESPEPRGAAAHAAIMPEPGRVVEVTGVDAVRADPAFIDVNVRVKPDDVVQPLTWNEDIAGWVLARGVTTAEAVANSKRLAAAIRVRTEPVA
ncbi:ATP-grasp domain-containing protein [Micromonospora halophytica]|uniref:ATP-grasp domain-containing protein n=1 Tax=Micromonospora halophytica TaxID=47864 RepID=UPI002480A984|nr:ATP-grasp domain-containing protein [Micromonospora halophytica]